ncbi:DMT family transporter [Luteolibacter sp. AS25]|uniref:DMT family transporter n=1 Tax=Luteolibacter sp. AS25 TaxID=3135776 RepID=UPI00398B7F69
MAAIILTAIALLSFAANSVLCRLALGGNAIDPVSFTTIRLLGGALALLAISAIGGKLRKAQPGDSTGTWRSGFALFAYALSFSLAYTSLASGTGALILFGAVQITMLVMAMRSGERLARGQWLGFSVAIAGLVYLLSPGISAPDPRGAALMIISGIAWSFYSIAGKGATAPIAMTTGNFWRAALITLLASGFALSRASFNTTGVSLALVSGIVTSGLGYVIWYRALPLLTTSQAAILQLLVPLLATLGGVAFISEKFTTRLGIASILILGGVIVSVFNRKKKISAPAKAPA